MIKIVNKEIKAVMTVFLLILLSSCSSVIGDRYSQLPANESIVTSNTPIDINILANWRGETNFDKLAGQSDLIIVGRVNSIYSSELYSNPYYVDSRSDITNYLHSFATCYDIQVLEVMKGQHEAGETVTFTYPGDTNHIKWSTFYGEPDKLMKINSVYLLFMVCNENKFTNGQHTSVNKGYSVYMVNGDETECVGIANREENPLNGMSLSAVREKIAAEVPDAFPSKHGDDIEELYSDPLNYMCQLSDTIPYQNENQLINTSDDIIIGTIVDSSDINEDIFFFTGKENDLAGQLITVKISCSLKGRHSADEKIQIFVRRDEEKGKYLPGQYLTGTEGCFFLCCMDELYGYHLCNGELQASLLKLMN